MINSSKLSCHVQEIKPWSSPVQFLDPSQCLLLAWENGDQMIAWEVTNDGELEILNFFAVLIKPKKFVY